MASNAQAGYLEVNGLVSLGGIPLTTWGMHGTLGNDSNGLPHLFGGFTLYEDDIFSGAGFDVGVSSAELLPPSGAGIAAELVIDYTLGFLPTGAGNLHDVEILGIVIPTGDPLIDSITVNVGDVFTDGLSNFWSALEENLIAAEAW